MNTPPPTGESKLLGVSIRSWAAVFLIAVAGGALAFAGLSGIDSNENIAALERFGLAAMAFLFGKAAGINNAKQ